MKVIVITKGDVTHVCTRRDGVESVARVDSVRAGLEMFAAELQDAIKDLP